MSNELARRAAATTVAGNDGNRNATLRNCQILFKNFSGKEGQYNALGDRNFNVALPDDVADAMRKDGWGIKRREPKTPDQDVLNLLKVKINYNSQYPPLIYMVTSQGKTLLPENLLMLLDVSYFEKADLIINPYDWSKKNSRGDYPGHTAYLVRAYITIQESDLDKEYAHLEDTGLAAIQEENPTDWGDLPVIGIED